MSLSKRCIVATLLILIVALAAVQRSDVHSAPAANESLPHPSRPINHLVRANPANPGSTRINFLPVQSKSPEDLGAGKLLVASRGLADPNFAGTVVLLVRCDKDSVLGLILNRRTSVPLSRVLDQFAAAKDRSDAAFIGGPMENQVAFGLLRSAAKLDGAEQVFNGVYFISTKDVFEKTVSGRPDPGIFHVYVGYSGWTVDQLRAEVERGSWFIFQGDARTVFDSDPDTLWRKMIQKTELSFADARPSAPDLGRSAKNQLSFAR